MAVSKLFVLCAFILLALCENAPSRPDKTATASVINKRSIRETEIDSRSRESKPKVSPCHRPVRLLIPVSKQLNPLKAYPPNVLPRRKLSPLVSIKPITLNATKTKTESISNRSDNNFSNTITQHTKDDDMLKREELENLKQTETTREDDVTTKDGKINDKDSKVEQGQETISKSSDPTTETEVDKDSKEKIEQTNQTSVRFVPNTTANTEIKNEIVKPVDENVDQVKTNETKPQLKPLVATLAQNSNDKLPTRILPNFKIIPGIPLPRSGKPFAQTESANVKEQEESENLNNIVAFSKSTNNLKNNTVDKGISDNFSTKIPTAVNNATNILVPRVYLKKPLILKPVVKFNNDSILAGFISLPKVEDETKIQTNEEPDISSKSSKTDLEEVVVIENNNYQEMYENITPTYTKPAFITSDLRPAQNWNIEQPSHYDNYQAPKMYSESSKPYSYEVKKYPNQYVVDTIDSIEDRNSGANNHNNVNTNSNGMTNTGQENSWPQRYNPYNRQQPQYFGQRYNTENSYQSQGYPYRIWRSWNNNHIYIRPKSGSAANAELYKGIGRYLANSQSTSTSVYNPSKYISSVYENQNVSPYSNPFQFKRYGY